MKGQLTVNGKTVEIELTQEQEKLFAKRTGYERVPGKLYYHQKEAKVGYYEDLNDATDRLLYERANYYSDKQLTEDVARADTLMRQMRRFAVEENAKAEIELDWDNVNQCKYELLYDYDSDEFCINCGWIVRASFQIHFATKAIAEKALRTFRDELLWYFTEYKDHL